MLTQARLQPILVICCKDYRYIQSTQQFVRQKLKIRWFDLKATAGGVRALLDSPRTVQRWILGDIDLVCRLHGVRRVIIVHHEDCSAYGGAAALGPMAQQRQFHRLQIRRAIRVLQERFPRLTIKGFLAYGYPKRVRIVPLR